MKNAWLDYPDLKCVVLCAGRGKRLSSLSENTPKVLNYIDGYPILHYVVNYWKQYTKNFVFVVHYKKEDVIRYVEHLPFKSLCVEQKELRGIADAVMCAQPYVGDKFIVVNGDSPCNGIFLFPESMSQGITVWEPKNLEIIKRNFSVEVGDDGMVKRVVEKPVDLPNKWCGIGYYFFRRRVFDYIKQTEPSALRGEVEITDVIQKMIDGGEKISLIEYRGEHVNVTFPEDLKTASDIYLPPRKVRNDYAGARI